jgi:hypothetical protein
MAQYKSINEFQYAPLISHILTLEAKRDKALKYHFEIKCLKGKGFKRRDSPPAWALRFKLTLIQAPGRGAGTPMLLR